MQDGLDALSCASIRSFAYAQSTWWLALLQPRRIDQLLCILHHCNWSDQGSSNEVLAHPEACNTWMRYLSSG